MKGIILAGGNGTRLWPISRTLMPKQFVKLIDNNSLFQLTVERNKDICENQLIVTNANQYFLANDQLENKFNDIKYIIEPIGKNTAPSIALACFALDQEDVVLVTPSDHLIKNKKEYKKLINKAKELAEKDYLVTFGIKPSYPETGYGYIEIKDIIDDMKIVELDVVKFHEKPDKKTADKYINSNKNNIKYLWNSGIFCFKVGIFLDELKKYSSKIYDTCKKAYKRAVCDKDLIKIKHEDMQKIPEHSIDYAVMEKSKKVKVIPAEIGWNDLGSFDALYDVFEKYENGNTKNENHISINSKNNLIYGNKKIVTVDIEDLIIVDTSDALLVSKKGSSQKIKKIVERLKVEKSELHNIHLTGYRPWGTYTVLEKSNGYKIKKIEVKPGGRLSLQKHFHRNEHWVVVSGTAEVEVGEKRYLVTPNESTYIKMGEIHRLSNPGKIPLILIEIQVGEYTGEDDIIRLEDDYQRK